MKTHLLWIGLFARGCNLIFASPANAPPVIEPATVGTLWTGEMGILESTAQLMAREKRLAALTQDRVFKRRLRAARQSFPPDPDSTPPVRWLPNGPLAGNPAPPGSPISPDSQTVGFSFTAGTLADASDSSTITAGTVWTYFYFQQDLVSPAGDTGKFADYPTLGIDANALYIGVNIFGSRGSPSAFSNTSVFVVRKSSVLSGGPIVVTAFRSLIKKVQGLNTGPY